MACVFVCEYAVGGCVCVCVYVCVCVGCVCVGGGRVKVGPSVTDACVCVGCVCVGCVRVKVGPSVTALSLSGTRVRSHQYSRYLSSTDPQGTHRHTPPA